MPKNPFQDWSVSLSPEGFPSVFEPLLEGKAPPRAWRLVDHVPVVSSTAALVEARMQDGSHRAFKHLSPHPQTGGRWQASTRPEHPVYWCREALFLNSETSRFETDVFRSVRCLGQAVVDQGISLSLEWVSGRAGPTWGESDYERAAYALGDWQHRLGSYPRESWVCPDWLGGYLKLRRDQDALMRDPEAWRKRDLFSKKEQSVVQSLLEDRERLLEVLRASKQLPAHNDFWVPNLFWADEQLVVIDWSFPGMGPIASDICGLMFDSIYDEFLAPADAMALLHRLRKAYAEGVRIRDCPELEFAINAGLVVKYLWFFGLFLGLDEGQSALGKDAKLSALQLVLAAGTALRR